MATTDRVSNDFPLELWAGGLVYTARLLGLNPSPERVRQAANQTIGGNAQAAVFAGAFGGIIWHLYQSEADETLGVPRAVARQAFDRPNIFVITSIRGDEGRSHLRA